MLLETVDVVLETFEVVLVFLRLTLRLSNREVFTNENPGKVILLVESFVRQVETRVLLQFDRSLFTLNPEKFESAALVYRCATAVFSVFVHLEKSDLLLDIHVC